jgi:transcriptional regulator with XRE-family HTH domain
MARNAGDLFDVARPLGWDAAPRRDRGLAEPETKRQPGNQTALGADEVHSGHRETIRASDIAAQGKSIPTANFGLPQHAAMDLGSKILQARKRARLTQIQLARRLRVKQSAISQWESGTTVPDIKNRVNLHTALRIPLQELLPEAAAAFSDQDLNTPDLRAIIQLCLEMRAEELLALRLFLARMLEERHREG